MKYSLAILLFGLLLTGCTGPRTALTGQPDSSKVPSPGPAANSPSESGPLYNPPGEIGKVDFRNFDYTWCRSETLKPNKIRLVNDRLETRRKLAAGGDARVVFSVANVYYQDFTGDGREEALVTVVGLIEPGFPDTCTYLFTGGKSPRVVWTHNNGDEKARGLRLMRVEGDVLVVEEYRHFSDGKETRAAPPNTVDRLKYKWNGGSFIQVSSERFPNDKNDRFFGSYPANR